MKQMSDSLRIGAILTFIGGFIEIYSFLLKGKVFATTITGNLILMFYNLLEFDKVEIVKYIFPIIGFSIGVVFSEYIRKYLNKKVHWRVRVIELEMLIVVALAFIISPKLNLLSICMMAFISGIQIQTFNKIDDKIYMSTMCTGNMRKLVESIVKKDKDSMKVFATLIISFGLGVIYGGYIISIFKEISILILLIPLMIARYFIKHAKN